MAINVKGFKDALLRYKKAAPSESDAAFYLFIVNDYNQIKGVISIRKLLLAEPESFVSDIRNSHPIKVNVDTDQEDVANIFQKYLAHVWLPHFLTPAGIFL